MRLPAITKRSQSWNVTEGISGTHAYRTTYRVRYMSDEALFYFPFQINDSKNNAQNVCSECCLWRKHSRTVKQSFAVNESYKLEGWDQSFSLFGLET